MKLYGERNTGTTYLADLLGLNLDVRLVPGVVPVALLKMGIPEAAKDLYFRLTLRRNLGWKHAVAPDAGRLADLGVDGVVFVTLTKNPYSWLLSLYRRPYHGPGRAESFGTFVTSPWATVGREMTQGVFADPVELWNVKNRSYIRLREAGPCVNLRYEDLLRDPRAVIGAVAERFGLRWRTGTFRNVERGAKPEDRQRSHEDYRRYYLEERWRRHLTPEDIALINDRLDTGVVREFSYALLDRAPVGVPE